MGFVDVKLSDVELDKPSPVTKGEYTFQLAPGAAYRINQYTGVEELNVSASVASEGDFQGRRVFWSYPDPTAIGKKSGKPMSWSAQALKKFELALGEDSLPGEDPATYLNRVALNGNVRFGASMVDETRKNEETGKYEPYTREGETEPRAVFSVFTVHAAA